MDVTKKTGILGTLYTWKFDVHVMLEAWLNSNFENIYAFVLIFMGRYQCYRCDAIALWIWQIWNAYCLTIHFPVNVSFDIEKTIWHGFECFQNGSQIALISMVMGLISLILFSSYISPILSAS